VAKREINQTYDLVSSLEHQPVKNLLESQYQELMAIGNSAERNVCNLFRNLLLSATGLEYFRKLNSLVKKRLVATTEENRNEICYWLDADVMAVIDGLCEADVFDKPKAIVALSDIIAALSAELSTIDEGDIEGDMDYLFDFPYQLSEMVKESPRVARFYRSAYQRREETWSERGSINVSEGRVSASFRVDLKR
jgi:hypothetical protein